LFGNAKIIILKEKCDFYFSFNHKNDLSIDILIALIAITPIYKNTLRSVK